MLISSIISFLRIFFVLISAIIGTKLLLIKLGVSGYGNYAYFLGIIGLTTFFSNSVLSTSQKYFTLAISKPKELFQEDFSYISNINNVISLASLGFYIIGFIYCYSTTTLDSLLFFIFYSIYILTNSLMIPIDSLLFATGKLKLLLLYQTLDPTIKTILIIIIPKGDYFLILFSLSLIFSSSIISFAKWYLINKTFPIKFTLIRFKLAGNNEILSFTLWSIVGNIAGVLRSQGIIVVLGNYFSMTTVAAFNISLQVQSAFLLVLSSLNTIITRKIFHIRASSNDKSFNYKLLFITKIVFYSSIVVTLFILLNIDWIMKLWLIRIPKNTLDFTKILLLITPLEIVSFIFLTVNLFEKNIKYYQIIVGGIMLLNIPIILLIISINKSPIYTTTALALFNLIGFLLRFWFIARRYHRSMDIRKYHNMFLIGGIVYLVVYFILFSYLNLICFKISHYLLVSFLVSGLLLFLFYKIGLSAMDKSNIYKISKSVFSKI